MSGITVIPSKYVEGCEFQTIDKDLQGYLLNFLTNETGEKICNICPLRDQCQIKIKEAQAKIPPPQPEIF